MRAAVAAGTGGPDVLSVGEVDAPRPAAGEVLVEVVATAVNRADTLQRQGFYPPPPGASEILGLECSGRIAELGEGVEGWKVGDEVCALLAGGGYAARMAVPVGQVMPVPSGEVLASRFFRVASNSAGSTGTPADFISSMAAYIMAVTIPRSTPPPLAA